MTPGPTVEPAAPPSASGPDADAAALRERGESILRALVGRPDATLREDQWTAIEALLQRRRALVVQRTGWGKSAVYFVATRMLREAGAGPTADRLAAARADAQPGRRPASGPASPRGR